ncbi:MAG TPA: hypothetical protein VF881_03790 [Polyangiaceae bacterium]
MKTRKPSLFLAGLVAIGCGGNVSHTAGSVDGGPDVSAAGGNAGAGGAGSGGGGAGGAAGVDWGVCSGPGQCVLEKKGCCNPCGTPVLDSFAAVNASYVEAYQAATCPVPMPCPRCATVPNVYFAARCVGTHCQAFDVRQVPELSACSVDGDCRLRLGLDCCECGSLGQWTAVSLSGLAALGTTVCAPDTACDDCAPTPPAGTTPICSGGHCEVVTLN